MVGRQEVVEKDSTNDSNGSTAKSVCTTGWPRTRVSKSPTVESRQHSEDGQLTNRFLVRLHNVLYRNVILRAAAYNVLARLCSWFACCVSSDDEFRYRCPTLMTGCHTHATRQPRRTTAAGQRYTVTLHCTQRVTQRSNLKRRIHSVP